VVFGRMLDEAALGAAAGATDFTAGATEALVFAGGDDRGLVAAPAAGTEARRLGFEARVGLGGFETWPGEPGRGGRVEGEELRASSATMAPHFGHAMAFFPWSTSSPIVETAPQALQLMFMTVCLPSGGSRESIPARSSRCPAP
jgi:hypothetical protein